MKKFNFLSKSSSQSCGHSSVTLASTVGSPSAHRRGTMLRLLSVLVLIFTIGVGNVWGAPVTVTYAQTSTSAASVSSGTAPTNSSVSFSNSFTTKEQVTHGNSMTLTLSGYKGYKITAISLSMKSNKSSGSGTFSAVAGTTTLASISSNTAFSSWYNMTGFTQSYTTVNVTMTNSTYEIKKDEDVTITINCPSGKSNNSLYCQSFTISYEAAATSSCTNPTTLLSISSSNTATLGTNKTLTTTGGNNGDVTWSVENGTGSATIEGATLTPTSEGTVTVTATQDDNAGKCGKVVTQTITISKAAATITLSDANGTSSVSGTHYGGDSYTLPNTAATCTGKTLVGWSTVEIEEEGAKPTSNYYDKGTSATLAAGANTFHAVYAKATTTTEQNHSGPSFSRASSSNSYTSGYTFTTASSMGSDAAYYQDGQATTGQLKLYHTSTAIFSSTPTKVKLTAKIGGGTAKSLDTPVYAQLLNSSGTAIGNATAITSTITTATGDTYTDVELDLTGITSAYGVTIYHTKQSQYNVRYYSFSLSYTTGGTTYSNYATTCCQPLAQIIGSINLSHF